VDVRVISATNKNIQDMIGSGRFREDLYFRINVVPIMVPPLRDRREDLPELVGYFLSKFKRPSEQEPRMISPEGLKLLTSYHWPGNIRELKNFTERITIMTEEPVISASSVKTFLGAVVREESNGLFAAYRDLPLSEARDRFERDMIVEKLRENGGNITRAAEALGLYASNLHSKMKKLKITAGK
jgi:two-component system nitrogen regulation response regulator NtrX